ncbi:GNAT family N-acetyltransferase [Microbacterium sp.]|uniref:GNAT family N-acetyltransferase n=1 Tax=Microbacterium sp. TaxID=51671 RepID=UPI00356B3A0F
MNVGWLDRHSGVNVYQSRGYGEAASSTIGAHWDVVGDVTGRWRVPLCIFEIDDSSHRDAVSPYGYSGIHVDSSMNADEVASAWRATRDLLAEREIVSVFFRFAPYTDDVARLHSVPDLDLEELSETVIIDLDEEETMWDRMHGRSRTAIRKAEREGLRARVVESRPLDLRSGTGFRRVYDAAMDRVVASSAHRHQDDYYDRLVCATDVDMRLIEVLDTDGDVVAATLLLIDEDAVHYHLSGSVIEAARNGANNLLIWTAMRWATEHGHKQFHLGGGTARDDGLFRFKSSFGGRALPFFVGRLIVKPDVYDGLIDARSELLGVDSTILRSGSFFPAYRAVAS